mmetsp:Transcript_40459/g.100630  ORF Transcript_40459/g.100630 Transcript_40459/m.100630 type:complete len:229 (-) Transcript_40459:562-1248(-)
MRSDCGLIAHTISHTRLDHVGVGPSSSTRAPPCGPALPHAVTRRRKRFRTKQRAQHRARRSQLPIATIPPPLRRHTRGPRSEPPGAQPSSPASQSRLPHAPTLRWSMPSSSSAASHQRAAASGGASGEPSTDGSRIASRVGSSNVASCHTVCRFSTSRVHCGRACSGPSAAIGGFATISAARASMAARSSSPERSPMGASGLIFSCSRMPSYVIIGVPAASAHGSSVM